MNKKTIRTQVIVNPAVLNPETVPQARGAEKAKASTEAIASTLKPFAITIGNVVTTCHDAARKAYAGAFDAWRKLADESTGKPTSQAVNMFHKAFKPVILKATGLSDGTVRNLLSVCRQQNGLPAGKIGGKGKGKGKGAAPDTISVRINSELHRFTLNPKGEEAENAVEGLYDILAKLQEVYGETLREAVESLYKVELDKIA